MIKKSREELVSLLKECQEQGKNVGIWFKWLRYGKIEFHSSKIIELNDTFVTLEGSYPIYFEGEIVIVKVVVGGKVEWQRDKKKELL